MQRTSVPKAAIHKDRDAFATKNKIGLPNERDVSSPSDNTACLENCN